MVDIAKRKAIFITGGGSGIGRATAQFFAAKGWLVGLADVNATGLAETAAMLPKGASTTHAMDVRERDAWVAALADFAKVSGGRIDVLFNNAGIGTGGPIDAMTPGDIERVLDINLKGVFWGAQCGLPYLRTMAGRRWSARHRQRGSTPARACRPIPRASSACAR